MSLVSRRSLTLSALGVLIHYGGRDKDRVFRILIIEDDPDDVFLFKRRGPSEAHSELRDRLRASQQRPRRDLSRHPRSLMAKLPDALVLDSICTLRWDAFLRSLRLSLALNDLPSSC